MVVSKSVGELCAIGRGTVLALLFTTTGSVSNYLSSDNSGLNGGVFCIIKRFTGVCGTLNTGSTIFPVGYGTYGIIFPNNLPHNTAVRFTGTISWQSASHQPIDKANAGRNGNYTVVYNRSISPVSVSSGLCINTVGNSRRVYSPGDMVRQNLL